jgi:ABC-2 type transport system ATP-binding protein
MMSHPAIDVSGVKKSFGAQVVLDGIDLQVEAGSIFALLGPNGAGKTTLISILSTLFDPDAGTARVAGFDVVSERENVKQSISLTGQSAAVDEVLTGLENIVMMARLSGYRPRDARRRAEALLARFDLMDAASKRVKTYSGGMRRRLDLALSLVSTPPVIFLDEPTTGLDTRSRQALWDEILVLARDGVTILLTTQYLDEADRLADRIAVLDRGVIVASGTADELKARVGGEVVELRDADDAIVRSVPTDGSLHQLREAIDELDRESIAGSRVNVRTPSLDDVFLALTNNDLEVSR